MTVSYTGKVFTSTGSLSIFVKLLWRWRGSIYRLVWQDILIYSVLYFSLSAIYRFVLSESMRLVFERLAMHCNTFANLIPVTFVLGFYVSIIITRWWNQFTTIPWPDPVCMWISCCIYGHDERGRLLRRSIARYLNLALVLALRLISLPVKKRFPTLQHVVEAGLMTDEEKRVIEKLDESTITHPKYWMPMMWAGSLVTRARREGRIPNDYLMKTLMRELNKHRGSTGMLLNYDWISIPLVYTQVVTLAVYTFVVATLMAHQFLDPAKKYPGYESDIVVPVFTFLQFFFYVGWLKVAEVLINPFGEDDDDFDLNYIIDRNLQVSYLMVDEMHSEYPELIKDQFWDESFPEMPYTVASEDTRTDPQIGAASHFEVPEEETDFLPIIEHDHEEEEEEEESPTTEYFKDRDISNRRDEGIVIDMSDPSTLAAERNSKSGDGSRSFNVPPATNGLREAQLEKLMLHGISVAKPSQEDRITHQRIYAASENNLAQAQAHFPRSHSLASSFRHKKKKRNDAKRVDGAKVIDEDVESQKNAKTSDNSSLSARSLSDDDERVVGRISPRKASMPILRHFMPSRATTRTTTGRMLPAVRQDKDQGIRRWAKLNDETIICAQPSVDSSSSMYCLQPGQSGESLGPANHRMAGHSSSLMPVDSPASTSCTEPSFRLGRKQDRRRRNNVRETIAAASGTGGGGYLSHSWAAKINSGYATTSLGSRLSLASTVNRGGASDERRIGDGGKIRHADLPITPTEGSRSYRRPRKDMSLDNLVRKTKRVGHTRGKLLRSSNVQALPLGHGGNPLRPMKVKCTSNTSQGSWRESDEGGSKTSLMSGNRPRQRINYDAHSVLVMPPPSSSSRISHQASSVNESTAASLCIPASSKRSSTNSIPSTWSDDRAEDIDSLSTHRRRLFWIGGHRSDIQVDKEELCQKLNELYRLQDNVASMFGGEISTTETASAVADKDVPPDLDNLQDLLQTVELRTNIIKDQMDELRTIMLPKSTQPPPIETTTSAASTTDFVIGDQIGDKKSVQQQNQSSPRVVVGVVGVGGVGVGDHQPEVGEFLTTPEQNPMEQQPAAVMNMVVDLPSCWTDEMPATVCIGGELLAADMVREPEDQPYADSYGSTTTTTPTAASVQPDVGPEHVAEDSTAAIAPNDLAEVEDVVAASAAASYNNELSTIEEQPELGYQSDTSEPMAAHLARSAFSNEEGQDSSNKESNSGGSSDESILGSERSGGDQDENLKSQA